MKVHTLEAPDTTEKIEDIPQLSTFTNILEDNESTQILFIPPGWQTTLTLTFDDQARASIEESIVDTHAGRVYWVWGALLIDV